MHIHWRRILKIFIILVGIFMLGIAGMYLYVSRHKKEMLQLVQDKFNDSYNGTLTIRDVEPALWKQFPNISLVLQDVVIRDTLWDLHKTDFINIKNVYLKLKFWPLLKGDIQIGKLLVSDAQMTLFENKDSVMNKGIFAKEKKKEKVKGKNNFNVNDFELENFRFKFTHYHNKKHFEFLVPYLAGRVDELQEQLHIHTKGTVKVQNFTFNTEKGSYFKNKDININIAFFFNTAKSLLTLDQQVFEIDGSKLNLTGKFYLAKADNFFTVDIHSDKIDYKNSLSWVPPTVKHSLDSFIFEKPINLDMHLEGRLKDQRIPYVVIKSNFVNNKLDSKFGQFDSLSFNLYYINGSKKDSLYGDEYSYMEITKLKTLFFGIPVTADTTTVYNLKLSKVKTHAKASFPVSKLNNLLGRQSFLFGKGTADIDLEYEGGMKKEAPYPTNVSAKIDIRKAEMTYLPRQIKLHDCNVFLQVKDNDIQVVESVLHTQKSEIRVLALARNFFSLYRTNPDKLIIDATVKSDRIDLNEFQSFLQRRTTAAPAGKTNKSGAPDFLDEALDVSRTNLNVDIRTLIYKRFEANNIKANLSLLKDGIDLHQVSLLHSNGDISLSGKFNSSNSDRPSFSIDADIKQASLDKLLYSFDNFGQESFGPENLRGTIDVKTKVSGYFNANAQLVPRSLNGTASFEIRKGELIDFKPLQRLGKLVFKKDRLARIHFEKIKNTLTIDHNKILIPPMWINSDLIDMQLQGVYNLDIGTDILVEIPLFKFNKDDIAGDSTLSSNKGFRLYVQAKDNELGETKFKLKLKNSDINEAREERKKNKEERKLRKRRKSERK
ncbi:MAG TPA: AsmA-like C-terminal region-containing protein [Chitinophagaceae bacterium]|nr:AsmA-like C-terminal region-containing protein [Chitinophagaceae bacterium]